MKSKLLFQLLGLLFFNSTIVCAKAVDIMTQVSGNDSLVLTHSHIIQTVKDGEGNTINVARPYVDTQKASPYLNQGAENDNLPFLKEEHNGIITTRRMTPAEAKRYDQLRKSSNNHIFTSYTAEGVAMTFKVLSESEKICQVGIGEGNGYTSNDVAINRTYNGTITIPSNVEGYEVIAIGNAAFNECKNLTVINIPNTIKSINFRSFQGCI